jgi:GGDEF domain-containing protein
MGTGKSAVNGLTDLIIIEGLQAIQDGLAAITGMSVRIIDDAGADITKPSLPEYRCLYQVGDEVKDKIQVRIHKKALETARETGGACIGTCPPRETNYTLVPIRYKQKILGNWLVKEIKSDKSGDREAGQGRIDPELWDIPAAPELDFREVSAFFVTFTEIFITYALIGREGKNREQELNQTDEKLEDAVNRVLHFVFQSNSAGYITDIQTNTIMACDKQYAHMFITEPKDLVGKPCFTFHGYSDLCPYCPLPKLIEENDGGGAALEWTACLEKLNLWILAASRVVESPDGRLCHYVRYMNITGYHRIKDVLSHTAYYDPILKTPNGILLAKNLNENPYPCSSLICLGLRRLRQVNESPQTEIRALLLSRIIGWVCSMIGREMTLYRITEYEFVLLTQGYTEGDAKNAALAIYQRFNCPWELTFEGTVRNIMVPVSMGIIPWTRGSGSGSKLVKMAQTILDMGEQNEAVFVYEKLETIVSKPADFSGDPPNLYDIDIKKINETGGGYLLSGGAYRLINQCINILYAEPEKPGALDQILGLAGSYLRVSRMYIAAIDNGIGEISHEWCLSGIIPEKDNTTHFFVDRKWREALEQTGLLIVSDINTLELKVRVEMIRQHVTSLAIMPLWKNRKLLGFIGFDECKVKHRRWKPEEIQILRQLSLLISGTYKDSPGQSAVKP